MIFGYVKDRHAAEDIAQEVFVRVYDHLDSFRQDSSYRTWIMRIAINAAKDYLRAAARRTVPVDDLSYVPGGETPEGNLVKRQDQSSLWQAVMDLPEIYREAVWLFYAQEFSVEEIANVTQVTAASVKTRLHRGRELLRRAVERGDYDESAGR